MTKLIYTKEIGKKETDGKYENYLELSFSEPYSFIQINK